MNRSVFNKKSSHPQIPRVDRFILPRDSFVDHRRRTWRIDGERDTIDIWDAKHQKQKKYRHYLDEIFGLDPQGVDPRKVQAWPCSPRRRGYLSSADSILDLPAYSYASFPELLDWSSDDILVAALGINYHLFSWKDQNVIGQRRTSVDIYCCKFEPKGDLLLVAGRTHRMELHSVSLGKLVYGNYNHCTQFEEREICDITAVDWSPTGNCFAIGCSGGFVISYSRTLMLISRRKVTPSSIRTVRISPNTRYVAAVAINCSMVHVLVWPSLEYLSRLDSDWIVQAISWHPWRSALLGVGVKTSTYKTKIAMWDNPSSQVNEAKLGLDNHYNLDVMLFSHRTGELVISLWNSETAQSFPKSCSQLLVMSDPNTVVDQSGERRNGLDRVRTMVFSPDGTKLATATSDEDLIIWNFLPEERNGKNTRNPNKFAAFPYILDKLTMGFAMR